MSGVDAVRAHACGRSVCSVFSDSRLWTQAGTWLPGLQCQTGPARVSVGFPARFCAETERLASRLQLQETELDGLNAGTLGTACGAQLAGHRVW